VSPAAIFVWPEQNGARTFFRRVEPDERRVRYLANAPGPVRQRPIRAQSLCARLSRRALIACAKRVREAERSSPNPSSLVQPGTPEHDAPASRQPAD
jgi:hypothetical protein